MHKDAVHTGGFEHREVHNMYGFYQVKHTTLFNQSTSKIVFHIYHNPCHIHSQISFSRDNWHSFPMIDSKFITAQRYLRWVEEEIRGKASSLRSHTVFLFWISAIGRCLDRR